MSIDKGKQFEQKFKEDFSKIPNSSVDRIYDSVSGYKTISNISDFICYHCPNIFYAECKSHLGNTFPLTNLTQYDKLKVKVGIPGVRVGVIIWYRDHDKVIYVPISTVTKMLEDNKKSINIKTIKDDGYNYVEIPSIKKRVFLDSDYSVLLNLPDGW